MQSWQEFLWQSLKRSKPARLALLGVGNQQGGDDGVGGVVARRLLPQAQMQFGVFVADHAPENCLGSLRRFQPDWVLMVDAARMGTAPGTIGFVSAEDMDGWSGSTHTLPLSMLMRYATAVTQASVYCLGVEPAQLEWGAPLSAPVAAAAAQICTELSAVVTFITPEPA